MCKARLLRLAATNHVFVEVSPDVFAHNRLSSLLDTGKTVEEVLAEYVSVFCLSVMLSYGILVVLTESIRAHTTCLRGLPGSMLTVLTKYICIYLTLFC